MKKRGVALFVAVLLAGGATAAPSMVRVIVAKHGIAAGTQLDGLISAGAFTTLEVPQIAVVSGAITDLSQLQGRTTSTFIRQDELAGGEVVVVVPDVQILRVAPVPNSNGGSDLSQKLVTLALLPQDAAKVLYAGAQGHVWFSLLPPGEQGQPQAPVTFLQVAQQQPLQVTP